MKVRRPLATISIVLAAGLTLTACGDGQDKPPATSTDPMMTGTTEAMMTGTTEAMMDHPTTTGG